LQFTFQNLNNQQSPDKQWFGVIVSIILGLGFFLSFAQPGYILTDGGIFGAVAFKDIHGGTLYINAWENKPPGIFYLIELFYLIIPNPVYALFVLALLSAMYFGYLLFNIAYLNFQSLILSLTFVIPALFFTIFANNYGEGLYTEIYGTLCLLTSIYFHLLSKNNENKKYKILALVFSASAFWFKEPFAIVCLPLMSMLLYQYNKEIKWYKSILYLALPSLFFSLLLLINGSFIAFLKVIQYNLSYTNAEKMVSNQEKLRLMYIDCFDAIKWVLFSVAFLSFQNLKEKSKRFETLMNLGILIAALFFIFVSPYNLGHYQLPLFALCFVVFSNVYSVYEGTKKNSKWLYVVLMAITMYNIDSQYIPKLKFQISPYKENQIVQKLKSEKAATLFVDDVTHADYYVKTLKNHPAFLPVGLIVHFENAQFGKKNHEKIWGQLNQKKADYLLTGVGTAKFSWSLPDTKFYVNNYYIIDSCIEQNAEKIYLWKRK
jgi:hypothetical protein